MAGILFSNISHGSSARYLGPAILCIYDLDHGAFAARWTLLFLSQNTARCFRSFKEHCRYCSNCCFRSMYAVPPLAKPELLLV